MNILVTGGAGYIGSKYQQIFQKKAIKYLFQIIFLKGKKLPKKSIFFKLDISNKKNFKFNSKA